MARFKINEIIFIFIFVIAGFYAGKAMTSSHKSPSHLPDGENNITLPHRSAPLASNSFNNKRQRHQILNFSVFSKDRNQKLASIISRLLKGEVPSNWEEEWESILNLTLSGEGKAESLLVFFSKWADADFKAALENAEKMPGYTSLIKREILSQFVEKSPTGALQYYENNKESLSPHDSSYLLTEIARTWAMIDPETALNWCLSEDNKLHAYVLEDFMKGIGYQSPLIKNYIDVILSRTGAVPDQIITDWAATDPESALNWINQIVSNKEKYKEALLTGMAKNDLNKATEMLMQLPENERHILITSISGNLPDAETALSWVFEIKPSSKINEIDLYPIRYWSYSRPEQVEEWLKNIPPSSARDLAIDLYIDNADDIRDYETSLEVIGSMTDGAKKEQTLKAALQKWQRENPDFFNAWMDKSENSPLLQKIKDNL